MVARWGAGTGRRSGPGRGARAAAPKASTISSKVSPRPTISPDLVVTSSPPSSLALRRTPAASAARSSRGGRPGTGAGTTSTLWLKTSGRSAITLASGISWPLEVGGEDLDLAVGRLAADLADHGDEGARRRSRGGRRGRREVMTAWRRPIRATRAGDAGRLERVVPGRLAGLHVAEAAAAGAGVAEDHEGRGAALPALADVRAGGLLADGVQVLARDQLRQLAVARRRPAAGTLNHGGLRSRIGRTSEPSTFSTSMPPGLARDRVELKRAPPPWAGSI